MTRFGACCTKAQIGFVSGKRGSGLNTREKFRTFLFLMVLSAGMSTRARIHGYVRNTTKEQ